MLNKLDITKESWPDFTDSTAFLRPACLWFLLAAQQQTFPPADNRFLGQRTVRVKALQLALRTLSAASVPPTHAFDGVLGLAGRTASQIELSSHTNCSAKQGLVLDADCCFRYRRDGHQVSLRLLSLLRGMNISPCHKKGKNAVSLLHVSDIPDLLVSCLLSFVSGYRENLYLSLSSYCQRVMSLSVRPSTHEVLDIISPPS